MKRKITAALLIAGLAGALLAGCGDKGAKQDPQFQNTQGMSQSGTDTQNMQDTQSNLGSSNTADDAAFSELTALLGEISSSVEAGTAGASLKAVPMTLALMDWASKYELDDDVVMKCVKEYLSALEAQEREEFSMQIELVYSDSRELLRETGKSLLEDAGCDAPNYPYDASKLTELDALMGAFS